MSGISSRISWHDASLVFLSGATKMNTCSQVMPTMLEEAVNKLGEVFDDPGK